MKTLQTITLMATGIGSLPHTDIQEAVELITTTFNDILGWPQLSKISRKEDMFAQFSEGFPGLQYDIDDDRYFVNTESDEYFMALEEFMMDYEAIIEESNLELLDKYAITSEYCHAFEPWAIKARGIQPAALKGQVTGPFTFATTLTDHNNKCAYYDETLKEIVEKFLALKAVWQIEQFKKLCPDAVYIMSMDEPSISQYGSSAFLTVRKDDIVNSLSTVADIIHKYGGISFTHCCGNTDWSIVTSSSVQMLNFDTYNFSDSLLLYPEDIKNFFARGGIIAWGLVPTLDPAQITEATEEKLIALFNKTVDALVQKGINKQQIIKQSIITPACGTGSVSIELAEQSLSLTKSVSDQLRSSYLGIL